MNRYDVVEIIEDVWKEDKDGHWNCKYKILSSFNNLIDAQNYHKDLILERGDIMTDNGWHKLAIMSFTN